mmetsp:Transcript_15256/g.34082  ORF Transcript_15256/g.34082 Transcript_15256/m.34082 type:complete len:220 (+) Transcript_15256:242-901(+)
MNDSTLPPTNSASGKKAAHPAGGGPRRGPVVARNTARNKVALRRGFGLHDWSLLCRSAKDLAQRNGAPLRQIKPEEIARHGSVHDAWISLHGKVYNITPYLHYHPGGVDIFKPCLGRDASALFDKYHRWVNINGLVGTLLLGYLDASKSQKADGDNAAAAAFASPPAIAKPRAPGKDIPPSINDGFAMPAPRPPKGAAVPSLLGSKNEESGEDEEELLS